MSATLPVVVIACVAMASSVLAEGTNRTVFATAQQAIHLRETGKTNEAGIAFQRFSEGWKNVEDGRSYEKYLYIKAAECFLAFGQPTNAVRLLESVLRNTGAALPPEALYLLVRSAFESGDRQTAIKTIESRADYLRGLPATKRQEMALIGAKASAGLGDVDREKRFLKDAVSIAPETQVGKDAKQELDRLDRESPP